MTSLQFFIFWQKTSYIIWSWDLIVSITTLCLYPWGISHHYTMSISLRDWLSQHYVYIIERSVITILCLYHWGIGCHYTMSISLRDWLSLQYVYILFFNFFFFFKVNSQYSTKSISLRDRLSLHCVYIIKGPVVTALCPYPWGVSCYNTM